MLILYNFFLKSMLNFFFFFIIMSYFSFFQLSVQVSELEKDKNELENELSALRDERLASIASQAADDFSENMEQVKEALQNKNKHILQLLADIEVTF